ncbi:Ig-like domain-containing protein [Escherichia albertii]|uniref:Ig-like domain-containing protein n=1 Tax=Escherichia albertii TaxID=208962 RepID=UPI000CF64A45|nr:Ig-like domain-containing protein [Escherichia albertii]
MRFRKTLAIIQIFLQIFSPSSLIWLCATTEGVAQEINSTQQQNNKIPTKHGTANQTSESDSEEQTIAQTAVQAGTALSSDGGAGSALVSTATGAASAEIQEWLNQFGTASVNISTDEKFSLEDSSLDVLLPLYDDQKENLLFTQLGGRRYDDRNMVNAGVGYRHFLDKWMWGVNVFYDQQISSNHHKRLGVGAEVGQDYLKFAANGYFRLSDWMASSRYEDYDERVANGFDIRATGYLPTYPQLGANVIYEQYYGDSVGLFSDDEDDRQKNPHAITVGLNYTPVPLVTLGLNQKFGSGGENDTQFNLALSWTPGVSFDSQLDPSQVAIRRSMMGSRQDLVDRNNNIVLEYRKQDLISLSLPPEISGSEQSQQSVTAKVKTKYSLDHIEWQGDSFFSQGGKITATSSPTTFVLTLPSWQNGSANTYALTGTAWDSKGNASNASQMKVTVNGIDVSTLQSSTTASPTTLPADGISTSIVTVTLKTSTGEGATGLASRMSASLISTGGSTTSDGTHKAPAITTFKETSVGVYVATFTSGTTPDTITVQPLIDGKIKLASAKIIEEAVEILAQLTQVDVSTTSALADGVTPITLTAHVVDQHGNVLKDQVINWRADKDNVQLSATQSTTDEQGLAKVQLTSSDVISTVVTAQLDQGNSVKTPTLNFTTDAASAMVTEIASNKMQITANNTDSATVSATVKDATGHLLPGVTVNWTMDKTDGTALGSRTSVTGDDGIATTVLKSAKVGAVKVSADVNGQNAKQTDTITFVADNSTQKVSAITLNKSQALANGTDSIVYEATVSDAQGNAIAGANVNWSADNRDVGLSATQTISSDDGKSHITVTSQKAGKVVITASADNTTPLSADSASFIPDTATATIQSINSDKSVALANNTDVITITATVVDAEGNALPDSDVAWSVTPAGGVLSDTTSKTDTSGVTKITLRSADVASYTVTATANSDSKSVSGLNFTVDVSTAHLETLTSSATSVIADGNSAITLTASVVDQSGHPVANEAINWSADNTNAHLSATQVQTNDQGLAQITVTSTDVISTVVTAQRSQSESLHSDTLNFTTDIVSAQVVAIDSNKMQVVANNNDSTTVSATVKDAEGHLLPNVTVNWTMDKPDGTTLGSRHSVTDNDGIATTVLKSAKAGEVKVSADVNGCNAKQTSVITFVADSSTEKVTNITLSQSQVIANGIDAISYEATVEDSQGNPVVGATVNWSADMPEAVLTPQQTVSDDAGKSSITVSSIKAGSIVVNAKVDNSPLFYADSATFIADKTTAKVLDVVSDRQSALANGMDKMHLRATIIDAHNNPVPNAQVTWSATPAGGVLSVDSSSTDTSGVAIVDLSSQNVATYQVTATSNGTNDSADGLAFTVDSATAHLDTLTSSTTSVLADGNSAITLTANVVDQTGHPVANEIINWSADNSNAQLSAMQVQTDEQGQAQITVTSSAVISTVITAQRGQAESLHSEPLNFTADMATAQVMEIASDKMQVTANAIDSATVSATVKDVEGHVLPGVTVNWTVDKTDGTSLGGRTSVTGGNGVATTVLKSAKVGAVKVSADVNGQNAQQTGAITFVADNATQAVTGVTLDKTTATANGTDIITYVATVKDAQGNPVTGATVEWSANMPEAVLTPQQTVSDDTGKSSITVASTKAGNVVVTVQTGTATPYATDSATFIADKTTAKVIEVTGDRSSVVANGTDKIIISATVTDAHDNPVQDATVDWTSTPAGGVLSVNSSVTDASGTAAVELTSQNVATYQVTASINGTSGHADGLAFTVDTASAYIYSLTADKSVDIVADKDTVTLTAVVLDANQHPIPNALVNWSSSDAANSTFTPASIETDAEGKAIVSFSSLKAGDIVVTAALATGSSTPQQQTLKVIGNVETARFASVTADKNEAPADGSTVVTWKAVVEDANHNLLPDVAVNWSSDNTIVTPASTSSVTDVSGEATTSGTAIKIGNVKMTAQLMQPAVQSVASAVKFVGDLKTAKLMTLSADTAVAVIGTTKVTYTALVKDANDNVVEKANVAWSTTLNNLSASQSTTNDSGIATIKLSGPNTGTAEVTAAINGTQMTDNTVLFVSHYYGDWNITGTSSSFNSAHITDFTDLGFIAVGDTQGPTALVWSENGVSQLTVPMTDEQGQTWNVVFGGQRQSPCSSHTLNTAVQCGGWTEYWAYLTYKASDNPTLPAGVYRGVIQFAGKDWHTTWALDYDITTVLTVE